MSWKTDGKSKAVRWTVQVLFVIMLYSTTVAAETGFVDPTGVGATGP